MKSIVICGSRRFKPEMREFAQKLKSLGVEVFEPHLHQAEEEWSGLSDVYKSFVTLGLTHDHFYKIRMADAVFVFNKDGYSGCSTTLEIGYAVACNKPIYAFAKDDELCRQILFREVVSTPEALAVVLGNSNVVLPDRAKVTICGSIAFFGEMLQLKERLEGVGCEVKLPPPEVKGENGQSIPVQEYYKLRKETNTIEGWIWDRKEEAIKTHFNKIVWSDAILVANCTKNNIENYIGANTLLEMGLAFHLGKKIYLLNPVPEITYKEEILGMKPVVLNGDLLKLKI